MSPVFRHGGLRLYLLKLLDEAPRHGYDVIRLLQDRFLGVYSPSPGTIYPRLARLEEEGLVTHEVIDGKKIYKITDAGRAELNKRLDDLADLEDEITASVRDIASQVSRDVRETVRTLRDELTWAVREAGRAAGEAGQRADAEDSRRQEESEQPSRDSEDEWPDWAHWAGRKDWQDWTDWLGRPQDWGWSKDHVQAHKAQWREAKEQAKAEWREAKEQAREAKEQAKAQWREAADRPGRGPDRDVLADLERLAALFAREVRGVARHAEAVSEDAAASLSQILGDAVTRIKNEVFRGDRESDS
jgi:DNA-binding PadR family transcriptional regulator